MGVNSYDGNGVASHGEMLALAARGYAVFIPNTRGRQGENEAFRRGISDGNYARLPFEDVMAGVDSLVHRGIADPARLGVMGHSYGGFLTGYAITQTNRFKSAVVYEGGLYSWVTFTFSLVPGPDRAKSLDQVHGYQKNPFEPQELKALIDQSPAFHMRCVVTPTLLLAGRNAYQMRPMFTGLTWFRIPVEFIGYQNETHAFSHISAEIDYVTRIGAWFDYWLRDMPYREQGLQKEYDHWRATKTIVPQGCPAKDDVS
jgi:dipeptidyl aminopeptidase/acylaminoacyl peptidase